MSDVQLWTYIVVGVTFAIYIWIGYSNRVRDTKGFYVAGQGVPPIANGAATAADWMSAATFISMAGLISTMGYDGFIYLLGWTGGFVLLALLLAPYLRKFGKYTVPDFVGDRYYSQTARLLAAIATILISLTYVAGQMRGVGIVFSRFIGLPIEWGVIVGMLITAFFALLGGMKGITWTQVAQYAVLILAYLIPAFAISLNLTGNAIPQLSFTFSDMVPRLNQVSMDLGFNEYIRPFQSKSMLDVFAITVALMVGTAGLPHVITRFYTVPNVRGARYSAGWALLFIALLYTTAPAVAAFARYNLLTELNGATIVSVEEGAKQNIYTLRSAAGNDLGWATSWQKTGLLAFNDKDGNGTITFTKGNAFNPVRDFKAPNPDNANEVYTDTDIIVLSTPEVAQLPAIIIALVAAGGLAAALSTAAGLLLAMSSAVSHDIYYRIMRPNATEKQRMFAGRSMILVAILLAGYFGINPPGFVGQVVAMAFGLAAATNFPLILMGIFNKRANSAGAIAGMSVGLIFTLTMILLMKSDAIFGMPAPIVKDLFGISAEGVGAIGMVLNLVTLLVVSRFTPAPPQNVQDMVESVRVPRGAGEAVAH